MRTEFEAVAGRIPLPEGAVTTPTAVGGLAAEWIRPAAAEPGRVVLYLHGGGYTLGSLVTHRALAARVALAADAEVLLVEYRKAPEHRFPAALDDALATVSHVRAHRPGAALALVGDSAGGGLALATAIALRDAGAPSPCAVALLSPWCDLALTGDSVAGNEATDPQSSRALLSAMAGAYLGPADADTPLASPLHADLRGLPPLLIQVGSAEMLLDDGRRLLARAEAQGVDVTCEVWQDMFHVWHALGPVLPEAVDALGHLGSWLGRRWQPAEPSE
ncbi:alpha/beta hydrolase [Cryptosporangium sp. NPDC051539]|uniref:alpha/beta hydrolase n=1 Tax=Cryptosporangium sp. NPDC051539 TaxID=3363962 RepID=UPI0037ADDC1E